MVDMVHSRQDYGSGADCTKFITPGAGRGRCVKNNAASGWNREDFAVTVFYKSGWSGAIDTFVSGERANLTKTKNENASHVVGEAGNERLTNQLYQSGGGRITAYFDGYLNTNGRHEGIDIAKGVGEPVHALIGGRVINVLEGSEPGEGGLSQIAIYNADLDKTIVYLHTNPRSPLEGENVSRGQVIGNESDRGAGAAAHTHVEMRPGRKERAADSTDDPNLTNDVPTVFWMNRGYNICC